MRNTIDHQKTKFYSAEDCALDEYYEEEEFAQEYMELESFAEANEFFELIKSSDYFVENGGSQLLELCIGIHSRFTAWYTHYPAPVVHITRQHLTRYLICHEIAHHLTFQFSSELPAHGATFTTHYLNLLYRFCGLGLTGSMIRAFWKYDVDHYPIDFSEIEPVLNY